MTRFVLALLMPCLFISVQSWAQPAERPRARDLGIEPGVLQPGPLNAITDVAGVRVGHSTIIEPPDIYTGVTAILPHDGNPYRSRVPAAIHVGNGFGKLIGTTQVKELGELESPILLTCTLCVWKAADAMVEWMLQRPDMQDVYSLNVVVGETNDSDLNAIRRRPVEPRHVVSALESAAAGPVAEGAVGAGAGTVAFGWKGGIGTSSRVLPERAGGYTLGVLVQSNFGGLLQIGGAPVSLELRGRPVWSEEETAYQPSLDTQEWGSIMIVIATDAPLSPRSLERVASRAMLGLGRTGSFASNGSGDYVIAFSTAESVRREGDAAERTLDELSNDYSSPLFAATVEATEEAIYNSLFKAETVTSNGVTIEALPLEQTLEILERHSVIPTNRIDR